MSNIWTQLYPPKPKFTEDDLPDLAGKVYIVTGSNTGVGKELAHILFAKNAKVYVAARSEEKAKAAIASIESAASSSRGSLIYLHLDLADLSTIKASADAFLAREQKLHVLFNNAGVMQPPQGSKSVQGYELQLGTNNLGTFLFTKLLMPVLLATAKTEPPDSVRVVWVSSSAAEHYSDRVEGLRLDNLDYHQDRSPQYKYGVSKAGNYYHAAELMRRHGKDGVLSVALNPGNLSTDLMRHRGGLERTLLKPLLHPPIFGAYTELFAGLSPEVTAEALRQCDWIVPWGRFLPIRKDFVKAAKPESEGGTGLAQKFWDWTEEQVAQYS